MLRFSNNVTYVTSINYIVNFYLFFSNPASQFMRSFRKNESNLVVGPLVYCVKHNHKEATLTDLEQIELKRNIQIKRSLKWLKQNWATPTVTYTRARQRGRTQSINKRSQGRKIESSLKWGVRHKRKSPLSQRASKTFSCKIRFSISWFDQWRHSRDAILVYA